MRLAAALLLLAALALPRTAAALVLLEEGRQLEGLWVFPLYAEPDRWVYLPTRARLALDEAGDPRFSFTFFVDQEPGAGSADSVETVRTAGGGAIVHFLVTYDAPEEQVAAAAAALGELHDDAEVELAGPVVFESGRYVVVSSSLASDGIPQALQTGRAPVLVGNELALSFRLEPRDADILLATFRTDTPDLSISFELDYSGLTQAYRAEMIVDWEKAQESVAASLGLNIYVVAAEAKTAIDRMRTDGAITLRVDGDDATMEKLVEHVSNKALELMFAPIEPTQIPPEAQAGIFEALGQALGAVAGTSSGSPMPFSISGAYELRDFPLRGHDSPQLRQARQDPHPLARHREHGRPLRALRGRSVAVPGRGHRRRSGAPRAADLRRPRRAAGAGVRRLRRCDGGAGAQAAPRRYGDVARIADHPRGCRARRLLRAAGLWQRRRRAARGLARLRVSDRMAACRRD